MLENCDVSGWGEIEVAVKEETFVQFADFRAVTFVRAGLAVGMTRLIKSNGIGRIAAELTRAHQMKQRRRRWTIEKRREEVVEIPVAY